MIFKKRVRQTDSKQEPEKKRYYRKEDLILFAKENVMETYWDVHAIDNIRPNKKYCMLCIKNNIGDRVKDISTGRVYELSCIGWARVGKEMFSPVEMTITHPGKGGCCLDFTCSYHNDLSTIDRRIFQFGGELIKYRNCWEFAQADPKTSFDIKKLKRVVDELNSGVHLYYEAALARHQRYLDERKKASASKLTERDKDF
ncbi:MAG: hypothetical protein E7375_03925 [Clostridiales bacterium]|nr:hypothetical protein [Clostridiales bacterium]